MRITGGILLNRKLVVPPAAVRPTQDRVREAMFSSLGGIVTGAKVLDLFAGSGALGLESWSRGAARVVMVERDRRVFEGLQQNVRALIDPADRRAVECIRQDVFAFLARGPADDPFDLILADPPYERDRTGSYLEKTLRAVAASPMLAPTGVLVYERGDQSDLPSVTGWVLARSKRYGKTRLLSYKRAETM